MDTNDLMITYLNDWHQTQGQKPQTNNKDFISLFKEYLKSIEYSSDVTFDGEGSYFGKQVTISKDTNYRISNYGFEIAYSSDHIRVYTSSHHGFYVPEFIDLTNKDEDFKELQELLNSKLKELFGLY